MLTGLLAIRVAIVVLAFVVLIGLGWFASELQHLKNKQNNLKG